MLSQSKKLKIIEIYYKLLSNYDHQGWWPIKSLAGKKGFDERGYHKGIFTYPKSREQRFEIVIGAILTQNTNWKNVEKALENLFSSNLISPEAILSVDEKKLAEKIRPAGYFNQKAKRLKNISLWFMKNDNELKKLNIELINSKKDAAKILEARKNLLNVHGVGFETADSILLYAYNLPIFVVDTYTKRLFRKAGLLQTRNIPHEKEYHIIQDMVHSAFSDLSNEDKFKVFNEFHALIVEWGKINSKTVRNSDKEKRNLFIYA
ncbi:MAG: hypothetical protein QXE90_01090 [Candidatus Micrarchaeia archaeon]